MKYQNVIWLFIYCIFYYIFFPLAPPFGPLWVCWRQFENIKKHSELFLNVFKQIWSHHIEFGIQYGDILRKSLSCSAHMPTFILPMDLLLS